MAELNRRQFLNTSARTAAALGASSTVAHGVLGANDRIRVAIAGLRSRGTLLINDFTARDDCNVAVICDPDTRFFDEKIKHTADRQVKEPQAEKDLRRVIDDKSIDAVILATPDHWHALGTVLACQAGKDVYVEKPVSHRLDEGRIMVEAARKYGRVVQGGTQRRSAAQMPEALEIVRSGALGHVGFVRTWQMDMRPIIGHPPDTPAPPGVDYDLWCGPAALGPFNPNRFHYKWHWTWEYGTGQIGNNGVHQIDLARSLLGFGLPERVASGGGLNYYEDDHQTPDTQTVSWQYPGMTLVWDHCMRAPYGPEGTYWGVALCGDKGTMIHDFRSFKLYEAGSKKPVKTVEGNVGEHEHVANFVDCMRSRNKPACDIEIAHHTAALCHLGNIAHRTGKNFTFDAKTMRCDDDEANKLMKRPVYRKGFVLPERV